MEMAFKQMPIKDAPTDHRNISVFSRICEVHTVSHE